MEQRQLGRSNINVSKICLGTMTWGEQNTAAEAFEQLDYALAQGINFIDTAEMYSVPPRAENYGATETIVGQWLADRGCRDKIVLASKVAGPADWLPWIRDGKPRFNWQHISAAIEGSLKRLQTDYLDLYQLHWPDRNTNYFGVLNYQHNAQEEQTLLEDTLEALERLVSAGKIRQVGLSNETPWGVMKSVAITDQHHNLPRPVSIQNPYNLLNRSFEIGLAECAHREQMGLLAYSPLAFGVLSGKYLGGARPDNARISLFKRFSRYTNPQAEQAVAKYLAVAEKHGLDLVQMSLAFVTQQPFVTSNIIGATSMEQLKTNIDSAQLELNSDVMKDLEAVHQLIPNPCP